MCLKAIAKTKLLFGPQYDEVDGKRRRKERGREKGFFPLSAPNPLMLNEVKPCPNIAK